MYRRTGRDNKNTWLIKLLLCFFAIASAALATKGILAYGHPAQMPLLGIAIFIATTVVAIASLIFYDRIPVKGFFIQALPASLLSIGALYSGLDKRTFSGLLAITVAMAVLKITAGEAGDADTKKRVIRIRLPWR